MIHNCNIDGLRVRTGDLICTADGNRQLGPGQFWLLIGKLIPGEVDHIVIYVGPGGRCVEAGAKGRVISFAVPGGAWDGEAMLAERWLLDELVGIVDPLAGRNLPEQEETRIRTGVAAYCLAQAEAGKPYNLNFLDPDTEEAFYCSQLAYKAYLPYGIDLNTSREVASIPGTGKIVFPQEIWAHWPHERPRARTTAG